MDGFGTRWLHIVKFLLIFFFFLCCFLISSFLQTPSKEMLFPDLLLQLDSFPFSPFLVLLFPRRGGSTWFQAQALAISVSLFVGGEGPLALRFSRLP